MNSWGGGERNILSQHYGLINVLVADIKLILGEEKFDIKKNKEKGREGVGEGEGGEGEGEGEGGHERKGKKEEKERDYTISFR